jgi:hypothetical protein
LNRSAKAPIEQHLLAELRRAELPYRHALSLLEAEMSCAHPTTEELSACLQRLDPVLLQIRELEATLAPVRQAWLALAQPPGGDLRSTLQRHEQLLTGLLGRVDALEQQARRARRELIPEMDALARRQQMQRAYQQSSRS